MKFTTVKRAVNAVHLDGDDNDQTPETRPVHGEVTFTPLIQNGDSYQTQTPNGPLTVIPTPITVRISDGIVMHRGSPGVQLFAAGPGTNPDRIQWRADFHNLQSNGVPITLKPVTFDAIPDGEVDLTIVAPLAGTPTPTLRGPQGTSIDHIEVQAGDLVIYGKNDTGTFIMQRVPMGTVTQKAANTAAADTVAKLQATLDSKADKTHSHTISQVTGLASELGARPNWWGVETAAELSGVEKKARVGDIIHVVETGEDWKVS